MSEITTVQQKGNTLGLTILSSCLTSGDQIKSILAHTSALEMTQLMNVLITDNNTIKTNYRWSKHPKIVSFLRQMYAFNKTF